MAKTLSSSYYSIFLIRVMYAAVLMNNKLFQAEQSLKTKNTPGHQPICSLRESCFPLALLRRDREKKKNASPTHTHTYEYADMTSYF